VLPGVDRPGEFVFLTVRHDGVDDEVLLAQAEGCEFLVGSLDLGDRGALGARDEDQTGAGRVAERRDGARVRAALAFQPGERSEAGRVALALVEEVGPRAGQLQEPDGVPGRGGVEDDVVVVGREGRVGEQAGELVERGDLGSAGAGELFLDEADLDVGQDPAHGPDDPLPVGGRGLLGVDLQGRQARDGGHRRDGVADPQTEDLSHVRGRIRAHQEHPTAPVGQGQGSGAGDRRLADAALAGQEQEAGDVSQERRRHRSRPFLSAASRAAAATARGALRDPELRATGRDGDQPGPLRQFVPAWVPAGQHGDTVDLDEGKGVGTGDVEELHHDGIRGKRGGFAREVETGDLAALAPQPLGVRGEGDQVLRDVGSADPGCAAQGGLEDLDGAHVMSPDALIDGCRYLGQHTVAESTGVNLRPILAG